MNLSRGTMMRLPRVWWRNPCGGLPRRHEPSRCPAHGTYPPRSASAGVHQRNSIWIFSFSSFLPFAQKDFILCFAAQFLSRLHGHVGPLLLMVGWLVPQGHALLLQLFQPLAVDLDSAGAEHPAHVVEQPGHCQHRRGRTDFLSLPTWQTTPPLLRVCCVIHIPPLPSSVNYLFRLLPVSIKRDRAPGSTVRDGRTFRADCRMAESTHALIDALSKTMWIRRRGDRAVPNQGQPHPGEIVLLLLLRENSQNRKVWNCKLFVNAERAVSSCPSRILSRTKNFSLTGAGYTKWTRKLPPLQTNG